MRSPFPMGDRLIQGRRDVEASNWSANYWLVIVCEYVNPLNLNISIQILHTLLFTFLTDEEN